MNNKLIKKIMRGVVVGGASFSIICSLFSCQKFLDREPLDQVSTPAFWVTPQELDAYIINLYTWLPGQIGTDAGSMGSYSDDQVSDNMVQASGYNRYMNGENSTTPASGGSWNWTAIRQINTFFDNYKKCTAPFAAYQQTYGEACFLKALAYHNMVKAFGDVPWYSHVLSQTDSVELFRPRDSRALVVDSILALMDSSIKYLKPRAAVTVNRINKETALIFKSRVALFEGTWAKYHAGTPSASSVDANKMFQKAIDAYTQFKTDCGGFIGKLYKADGTKESYHNLFGKFDYANVPEVTLSRTFSNALFPNSCQTGYVLWEYGYGGCTWSLDMARSYLKKDGTSVDIMDTINVATQTGAAWLTQMADLLDPRFRQSIFVPGDYMYDNTPPYKDWVYKEPRMNLDATRQARSSITGMAPKKGHNPSSIMKNYSDPAVASVNFRIPELMLNYVEAYVELKGALPDLSDNIDLLRDRVGMPALTGNLPDVTKGFWPNYGYPVSNILAIVRQERRVELAGEGFRTNDWKRWRAHALFNGSRPKGFRYSSTDALRSTLLKRDAGGYMDPYNPSGPIPFTANGGVYKFNDQRDYLSPLPMDQLIKNKKLTQNPGWDSPK
ncbi:RagB/SusD family nutrient uptake outer membrane protein [Chitinophagaceae bacterium LB-8]|uniref:RagB/SusD family nutrient uptake outer membrane protein n=1 Tax=Paraflavisolibacter caeni TaxID=2982496 RepID=A0A9X3B8H5_9BACT|nr:RagB/SusD family nutrient uptake outer membrane protein [Paraflavisolibacter caeni]MCU7549786.1 RagB/SusD family nutrient uptake outer membrane protein [Paraflavisolibacter caeni]